MSFFAILGSVVQNPFIDQTADKNKLQTGNNGTESFYSE